MTDTTNWSARILLLNLTQSPYFLIQGFKKPLQVGETWHAELKLTISDLEFDYYFSSKLMLVGNKMKGKENEVP